MKAFRKTGNRDGSRAWCGIDVGAVQAADVE